MFLNYLFYYFSLYILTYWNLNKYYHISYKKFIICFFITICVYPLFQNNIVFIHILLIYSIAIYIGLKKKLLYITLYCLSLNDTIISTILMILKLVLCHFITIDLAISLSYVIISIFIYPIYKILCYLHLFSSKIINSIIPYLYPIIYLMLLLFISIYNNLSQQTHNSYLNQLIHIICIIFCIISYIILISIHILKNQKKELNKKELNDLMNYVSTIDENYNKLRHFKHDFNNIMLTLDSYIYNKDFDGLQKYYYSLNTYIHNELNNIYRDTENLSYIENIPLKSLLISKINLASQKNIDIKVLIYQLFDIAEDKTINICRIIGILLDNAIAEVSQLNENKNITIIFSISESNASIKIKNPYRSNHNPISFINAGISSKEGNNHGLGLKEIRHIIKYNKAFTFSIEQNEAFIEATIQWKE